MNTHHIVLASPSTFPQTIDTVTNAIVHIADRSLTCRQTILAGDFRAGNILVVLRSPKNQGDAHIIEKIYALDWELRRTGPAGADVGHYVGELDLLSRYTPQSQAVASAMIAPFLKAYREATGTLYPELARDSVMHSSTHAIGQIVFAGQMYGTADIARQLIEDKTRDLVAAYDGNTEELLKSIFAPLYENTV